MAAKAGDSSAQALHSGQIIIAKTLIKKGAIQKSETNTIPKRMQQH